MGFTLEELKKLLGGSRR